MFSSDNEILISFVNLHTVTTLPDPVSLIPGDYDAMTASELKTIDLKEETVPGKKRLCRIGAAVTNEEFRRWAVAGKAWSLPANVIMVEVSKAWYKVVLYLIENADYDRWCQCTDMPRRRDQTQDAL